MKGEEGGEFITGAWLDCYKITEERSSSNVFGKQGSSRSMNNHSKVCPPIKSNVQHMYNV